MTPLDELIVRVEVKIPVVFPVIIGETELIFEQTTG
jgi:hypothetical protein